MRDKIEELERLDIDLDHCIGCGCLSLKRCKLTNPNDRAARSGPGARRWLGDPPPEDLPPVVAADAERGEN